MLKSFKYRFYPNKTQEIQIQKTFGCCRFVYNQTLAYRKNLYETEKKSINKIGCNNYVNQVLKKKYDWLKEADKFALTNSVYNMDNAYQNFLKNIRVILNSKARRIIVSLIKPIVIIVAVNRQLKLILRITESNFQNLNG